MKMMKMKEEEEEDTKNLFAHEHESLCYVQTWIWHSRWVDMDTEEEREFVCDKTQQVEMSKNAKKKK